MKAFIVEGYFEKIAVSFEFNRYCNNNRLYIGCLCASEYEVEENPGAVVDLNDDVYMESYGDITINLPDALITDNLNVFLSGDNSEEFIHSLEAIGLLKRNGLVSYNYGRYFTAKVNPEFIREHYPEFSEVCGL